nr:helix-turn-helix domain-containing protein [Patulibacter sp.]
VAATAPTDRNRRSVRCARALLLAAAGTPNARIAAEVGVAPATVRAWRSRFGTEGLNVLGSVRPGRGRRRRISAEMEAEIVRITLHESPPNGRRWTCRSLARATGVSPSTVQRLWAAHGIDPRSGRQSVRPQRQKC